MKKTVVLLIVLLAGSGIVFSQTEIFESPFLPVSPEVMGQGGSFVAAAHGYNSLFYNPAGFARPDGSFTLASATAWMYSRPDRILAALEGMSGFSPDELLGLIDVMSDQITSGGFGVGTAESVFGIVGRGFGLGATFMVDSYVYGRTVLGAEGELTATLGAIAGYAFPFELFGIKFSVGGDLRPMMRIHVPITNQNISQIFGIVTGGGAEGEDPGEAILNSIDALYGWGLGLDVGAIMEIAPFSVGISVRDLFGTRFQYMKSGLKSFVDGGLDFSQGTPVDDTYVIPMNIYGGFAFHPDLGFLKYIIDPTVHIGLEDPIGVFRDERSPWTLLHLGGEVRLLSLFSVRAGLNQGYITVGAGAKLLFLDVNFALFTRELGKRIGDRPNSGVTFEAALRF